MRKLGSLGPVAHDHGTHRLRNRTSSADRAFPPGAIGGSVAEHGEQDMAPAADRAPRGGVGATGGDRGATPACLHHRVHTAGTPHLRCEVPAYSGHEGTAGVTG